MTVLQHVCITINNHPQPCILTIDNASHATILVRINDVFALVVLFRVRKVLKSEEAMEQWQKEDLREVRYLVIYPIIYLVLNIFSFINRLDITIQEEEALLVFYYFHILTSPFRGAVIALAFIFDPDTRKRLANPRALLYMSSSRVREYSMRSSEENFDASGHCNTPHKSNADAVVDASTNVDASVDNSTIQ